MDALSQFDNILIVDDNTENLTLLSNLLKEEGFNVFPADSGELALASLDERKPDLILLDIRMKGIDGFEVCRRIKQNRELVEIPIIFLTVASDISDKLEGFRLGAVDYVTKPFQKEELLARIKTHLNLYRYNMLFRENTAERLIMSEERFRVSFENAALGMCMVGMYGDSQRVNKMFCSMLGYTEDELLSKKFNDITHPDDFSIGNDILEKLINGDMESASFEKRYIRKNGDVIDASVSTSLVRDNDGKSQYFITQVVDITEQKRIKKQIEKSLAEKETLLRELYHRTKNNMQVINSLLDLQLDYIDEEVVHEAFEETKNRICSMALVHQKLYETRNLSQINLREYIHDLSELLRKSSCVTPENLSFQFDMDDVWVFIDTAIPCGLIINELISNAMKYAFSDGRPGEVEITLRQDENGEITLSVADNGVGLGPGFDARRDGNLGFENIFTLTENQLLGTVTFEADEGVTCRIKFNDRNLQSKVQSTN